MSERIITGRKFTKQECENKIQECKKYGRYAPSKWVLFCRAMHDLDLKTHLYESKSTKSKYIYVSSKKGKVVKVRFSDHRPAKGQQIAEDSDFYVGVSHFGNCISTEDLVIELCDHFGIKDHSFMIRCDTGECEAGEGVAGNGRCYLGGCFLWEECAYSRKENPFNNAADNSDLMEIRTVATEEGVMDIDNFRWRTKDRGVMLKPSEMDTKHVFFTLRMIYNNSVPDTYRHQPVRIYKFDDFYTDEYMALACRAMIIELSRRNDLTSYFHRSLGFMRGNLNKLFETRKISNG